MKPIIAIVGRPNVGKSTLFNRLTRSRDALVADQPGLTRDRIYGIASVDDVSCVVIDTGGLSQEQGDIQALIAGQADLAVQEADAIVFMVDGRANMSAGDESIADYLRRTGKPVHLAANKTEGLDSASASAEFHSLGLGSPHAISASQGFGVSDLMAQVLLPFAHRIQEEAEQDQGIKVAVVGRPNAGKSTLINRLMGEQRVLAYDQPGTTRDSIYIPFQRDGQAYTLIDTAGVRRRSRVTEAVEKFSIAKTLQAIIEAHVVILLLDAREGVTEQDARLAGHIVESGRALIVAVNKWDGLEPEQRTRVQQQFDFTLPFLAFASQHYISALHGSGVGTMFDVVARVYASATRKIATPRLTRVLQDLVTKNPPPMVRGRRIKLRYAHQGGQNPPVIVIHGNQVRAVPDTYRRYLANAFRQALRLQGTPVRIEFKGSDNPYQGKKNPLTRRQQEKRKRLKRHVSRR